MGRQEKRDWNSPRLLACNCTVDIKRGFKFNQGPNTPKWISHDSIVMGLMPQEYITKLWSHGQNGKGNPLRAGIFFPHSFSSSYDMILLLLLLDDYICFLTNKWKLNNLINKFCQENFVKFFLFWWCPASSWSYSTLGISRKYINTKMKRQA